MKQGKELEYYEEIKDWDYLTGNPFIRQNDYIENFSIVGRLFPISLLFP